VQSIEEDVVDSDTADELERGEGGPSELSIGLCFPVVNWIGLLGSDVLTRKTVK
jgi:hypothetical protein